MRQVILLAGGIGAGKSVVSRVLRLSGYTVYDCDSEAKRLMDRSSDFLASVSSKFGEEYILPEGCLNRGKLAERVFSDAEALKWLNSRVHSMVREDISLRIKDEILFVESAIPVVSGLLAIADAVWWVDAPVEQRATRATARGNVPVETVYARMKAQQDEFRGVKNSHLPVSIIENADDSPVVGEIQRLLKDIEIESGGRFH